MPTETDSKYFLMLMFAAVAAHTTLAWAGVSDVMLFIFYKYHNSTSPVAWWPNRFNTYFTVTFLLDLNQWVVKLEKQ